MGSTFISVIIAILFAVLFLAMFPTINTMLRSWVMPNNLLPIVSVQVTLMPYAICGCVFFVVVQIVRHRIQG
jgi:hypothetical protein